MLNLDPLPSNHSLQLACHVQHRDLANDSLEKIGRQSHQPDGIRHAGNNHKRSIDQNTVYNTYVIKGNFESVLKSALFRTLLCALRDVGVRWRKRWNFVRKSPTGKRDQTVPTTFSLQPSLWWYTVLRCGGDLVLIASSGGQTCYGCWYYHSNLLSLLIKKEPQ